MDLTMDRTLTNNKCFGTTHGNWTGFTIMLDMTVISSLWTPAQRKAAITLSRCWLRRTTEAKLSSSVVLRRHNDARTRSHDGLCTATTAAIRELTEPIRKTAEAIPDSPRKNTEAWRRIAVYYGRGR